MRCIGVFYSKSFENFIAPHTTEYRYKNPKVTWNCHSLPELITDHGKEYIFIREPEDGPLKWTFIYATNWVKQKELRSIKLFNIKERIGEQIVEHLSNPKNPRPYFGQDGSRAYQTNLFDSSDSILNTPEDK